MKELRELLQVQEQIGLLTTGKRFITLECRCVFEGFGKASEDWDEVWVLRCEVPNNMTELHIKGKSYDDVMERAKAILKSGYGN